MWSTDSEKRTPWQESLCVLYDLILLAIQW